MPDGAVASADLAVLRAAYARRLLRMLVERARTSEVVHRLVSVTKSTPELGSAIVLDPTVSVSIETGHTPSAISTIAVSLARLHALGAERRALPRESTLWSVEADLLVRARSGLAIADGSLFVDGQPISLTGDASPSAVDGAVIEHPFPTIVGDVRLALFDPNPYALHEAHPDKDGNALSLGGRSVDDWLASLRTAFTLIDEHLPAIAAEMRAMLRLVLPVGASDERHLSASYREYVGAVYLSLHRDPVTMAEALVHEFQHNKLNLLSWHYPILENGYDFLYRSPVRPDPRPLMGILLAAHAFVPVAELHRRLLAAAPPVVDLDGVRRRLADVVAKNEEALSVLDRHARPAPAGTLLLGRLGDLHAHHRTLGVDLRADVTHVA